MTIPGLYMHYKGAEYRVLFVARVSTNGPDEGKNVVVYVSLTSGRVHVRDEQQFYEVVVNDLGETVPRFDLIEKM